MNNTHLKKLKMPDSPGVYFFKKGKEIIYIGKATSLRDRVKSYFGKDLIVTRGPFLVDMIFHSDKVDWQGTESVLEALILEAALIKKYQPKYNTKEKDDKSFNYVIITKEKLPRVLIVRERDLESFDLRKFSRSSGRSRNISSRAQPDTRKSSQISASFGPYTNGRQLKEALKIIRRIFPFFDDKSKNYYEFYKQVELVPNMENRELGDQYKKNIQYLKLFLKGKKKEVERSLKKEMMLKAKTRQFEQAGELKRQLFALKHINDVALLNDENLKNYSTNDDRAFRIEAYDIAHMSGRNMVGVMTVVENNNACRNEYRKFKIRTQENANDTGALLEVILRRFNHPEWKMPNLIVVDGSVAQIHTAEKALKDKGLEVPIVAVVKDERHKPKALTGDSRLIKEYKSSILLANSEAHRFAINYHKNMRGKNFLNLK